MNRVEIQRAVLLAAVCVAVLVSPAGGDFVYTRTAPKPLRGLVLSDDTEGVKVNPFFSDNPRMTWGVELIPRKMVVRVLRHRPPGEEYLARAAGLRGNREAAKHLELARWCKGKKLKAAAKEQARRALVLDPKDAEAAKILGASAARKFLKERKDLREKIIPLIEQYALLEDPRARKDLYGRIKKAGFRGSQVKVDRIARSLGSPRGKHLDQKLLYRSEEFPGAVYSVFVPEDYTPHRTWPLVMGLHGGGRAGKDGKEVVGSGPQALMKYGRQARARGYILVCPTALTAPWPGGLNGKFLTALFWQTALLYNVDLNRVYLCGHSMGGGGTWNYGPMWAETLAAIAPLSAYSEGNTSKLHKTRTGIYLYHGDNDDRCPVSSSRNAAKSLRKLEADFRYTEIPGSGHSCPPYIVKEMFDYFDCHRLSPWKRPGLFGVKTAGSGGPYSSFLLPRTPEELKSLAARQATGIRGLLVEFARGGAVTEKAARAIAAHGERAKAVGPLVYYLGKGENEDVRRLAAWTLGEMKAERAVSALGAAQDDPVWEVRSEASGALAKVGGEAAREQITRGATLFLGRFESRLTGAGTDSVDWENSVRCWLRYLDAAGKIGDGETAAALGKTVFEGVLLRDISVRYDRQVQPDPKKSLRRLALEAVKTARKLKSPVLAPFLERLAEKRSEFPDVAQEAKEAAAELR
jgi:hypothetical protein